MSRNLAIETAAAFLPLLQPARYKGAWGGRGSGKSHFFADHLVESSLLMPGFRGLCVREVQQSLQHSAKRLLEDRIRVLGVVNEFRILHDRIETPGGGVFSFVGMQDHTAESIKSYEGFNVAWVEEAQVMSERSLTLLRPTIRAPGSEIWASWNPRRKADPIDRLLRGEQTPTNAVVVKANWSDNPWFTKELEQERLDCLRMTPEEYDHIWEGGYAAVTKGAYYAAPLTLARAEGRIGRVAPDPLMAFRAFFDIGGTGAKSDACAIWIAQFIGREIRVVNYYEAIGQPLATHVNWLRENGYAKAECILPHDGATHDRVYQVSYESSLKEAGFSVTVVPNQGAGAAMMRVQAGRRLFPSVWFNATTCEPGLEALGAYHERRDESRQVGLGPKHDWSSNCADAFGLMCVVYEAPKTGKKDDFNPFKSRHASPHGWQAA